MAKPINAYLNKLETAINKTPARQYYMMFSLVILVVIKFVFVPWSEQISEQRSEMQQLANTVKTPELMIEQTQLMEQALAEKQQLDASWRSQFYNGSESQIKINFVNKLQASAKSKDLLFLRSRWVRSSTKTLEQYETLVPMEYTVMLRGDYNPIRELIQEWQGYSPLVNIRELHVVNRAGQGVVTAAFKITIYRLAE